MFGPAFAGGLVGAVAAAACAVRGTGSQWFCESIHQGPSLGRMVALTFDDGPSQGTLELLDALSKDQARATFFQCGVAVERLPAVAKAVAAGHEIGNHTHSHPFFHLRTPAGIGEEIGRAQAIISSVTGQTPRWFRPPYGIRWFGLRQALRRHGLQNVMWTVMGNDWALPEAQIANRVARLVRPGAIICLHDGREGRTGADIRNTVAAVRQLVPRLVGEGYRLVTLSELLCPRK